MITTSGLLLKFRIYVEKENIIVYDYITAGKIGIGFADPVNLNKSNKVDFWYYFTTFLLKTGVKFLIGCYGHGILMPRMHCRAISSYKNKLEAGNFFEKKAGGTFIRDTRVRYHH